MPVIGIVDVYITPDAVVYTTIYTTRDDIEDVFGAYVTSVQINGEAVKLTWTLEEIEALPAD